MASEKTLQLFPKMSSLRRGKKGSLRHGSKMSAQLPEFEILNPAGKSNGFVIHIAEDRPSSPIPIAPPSRAQTAQDGACPSTQGSSSFRPQPPPLAIPGKAHIAPKQESKTPPNPPGPPQQTRPPSPADIPLPQSSTSTPIPVQSNSKSSLRNESTSATTPVMRSMFPQYDPNRPLHRQSYYPNTEAVPGLAAAMAVAGSSSNNPYRQAGHRSISNFAQRSVENVKSETASIRESPLTKKEFVGSSPSFSRPEELLELWATSNGQAPSERLATTYNFELSCDDLTYGREVITFNSSNSDPVYMLETSHSNITISRIHPVNRAPKIQVASSVLSQPTAVEPLVTSIFPKLAGLMALDQSSSVAVAHKLDRQASTELQVEAVQRAQEKEASMLLWDDASNKYCLLHPTLLDSTPTPVAISIYPKPSSPKTITICAPETNSELLELSITTLTLTVHTSTITALPNLYFLDTLMTCLLSLLLHLHRACATPRIDSVSQFPDVPMFPPPPVLAHSDSRSTMRKKRSVSRLSGFRSNRSIKSARSTRAASAYEQDIELQSLPPVAVAKDISTTEKYQPPKPIFSTDDESLPKATRAVLKLLYWSFEVIFWIMNVVAQFLAAAVVGAGKLITKL